MLDFSHIPSQQQSTTTFYASSGSNSWQTWTKPRNAKMIEIFCLGGGGGGGVAIVSTFSKNGGAGGSSAGIVRGLIPAFLLPDTLYIQVGKGGVGASTSNSTGGSGAISYVSLQPSTSEQTLICKSSTGLAQGGLGTSGGTAATISVVALSAFGNLGLFTAIAGVAGSNGGSNTGGAGVSQAALGTNLTTGGGGGGGATNVAGVWGAGGNITSASVILTTAVPGGQTAGADGATGYGTLQPFCGTGGSGGAGRDGSTGAGGNGGNGFYGCGGAGAGGSSTVAPRAGNGGDGLVIITVIT